MMVEKATVVQLDAWRQKREYERRVREYERPEVAVTRDGDAFVVLSVTQGPEGERILGDICLSREDAHALAHQLIDNARIVLSWEAVNAAQKKARGHS
jgi:hypothetical protein